LTVAVAIRPTTAGIVAKYNVEMESQKDPVDPTVAWKRAEF